jgi:hypothetical protein
LLRAKGRSDHLGELPYTFPWRADSFRDLLCLLPVSGKALCSVDLAQAVDPIA